MSGDDDVVMRSNTYLAAIRRARTTASPRADEIKNALDGRPQRWVFDNT